MNGGVLNPIGTNKKIIAYQLRETLGKEHWTKTKLVRRLAAFLIPVMSRLPSLPLKRRLLFRIRN
jgi:hypothetical protein